MFVGEIDWCHKRGVTGGSLKCPPMRGRRNDLDWEFSKSGDYTNEYH